MSQSARVITPAGISDDQDAEFLKAMLTLQRGTEVLRAFRSEQTPLSNTELVRRTGLPKATVSRITTTLVALCYLKHVPGSRDFVLGSAPLIIGHAFVEASPLLQRAVPFMQKLADRLDVSVALAIGDRLSMLYIGYCTGKRIATLRLGVGSLLPMGTTAIGRAYLHGLAPSEREERVAMLVGAAGARGVEIELGVQEAAAQIASTGACFSYGGYRRNVYGNAVPLHAGTARTPMAMSCGAVEVEPYLSSARKRITPEIQVAALELEALLSDIDEIA